MQELRKEAIIGTANCSLGINMPRKSGFSFETRESQNDYKHRRPMGNDLPLSRQLIEKAFAGHPGESLSFSEIAREIEPTLPRTDKDKVRGAGGDRARARRRFAKAKLATYRGLQYEEEAGRLERLPDGKYRLAGGSLYEMNEIVETFRDEANLLCDLLLEWEKTHPSPFLEPTRRAELQEARPVGALAADRSQVFQALSIITAYLPYLAASGAIKAPISAAIPAPQEDSVETIQTIEVLIEDLSAIASTARVRIARAGQQLIDAGGPERKVDRGKKPKAVLRQKAGAK